MKILTKVLGNKWLALAVLIGIGVWLLAVPAVTGNLGTNPLERLLHKTGKIGIWMLGAVLALTPLRVLFPASSIVVALNRHRRYIGVGACVYGLLHFGLHIVYEGNWEDLLSSFSKPFIWYGLAGLTLLTALAATSNTLSMRLLGGRNWKHLHRLAYLAAALLLFHQSIAGKGHWRDARWIVIPLVALEAARLVKTYLVKKPARAPAVVVT